jgi:enoyl-CoA hydratase
MSDFVEPKKVDVVYETDEPVLYTTDGAVATITMNRPQFHNSQNSQMTYALDAAFRRATDDDAIKVIILAGTGKHFSAGHDIGTPGRDITLPFERKLLYPDHTNKPGAEMLYTREQEVYLGMCRRWRDIPKPTIACVQGACIAGGLGIPGVEYFAHGFELPPRVAKEFLLLGERMPAARAYQFGMVNRLFPRETLAAETAAIAAELATRPRLGNWLSKQALNHVEELRGKRSAMDAVFHMHHFAHAQNDLVSGNSLGGLDGKSMAAANKSAETKAQAKSG